MLVATPGMIAPAATATKPAIGAYSMRSWPGSTPFFTVKGPAIQANTQRRLYPVSVAVRSCVVSFLDSNGLRHSVQVQAASVYEAAVIAIGTFRQHDCQPGPASWRSESRVRESRTR